MIHLGFFNWSECPHIFKHSARALGERQKNGREKMNNLFTEVPWVSLLRVGVHQRGSWRVKTSFPTRKVPERKNLCLKNSSPVNHETEISWCALLPWAKHFGCLFPSYSLLLPFTNECPPLFGQGINPFPCSRDNFRGAWRFFPSTHNNNPKLSDLTPIT